MSGVYAYCIVRGGLRPPSGLRGLLDRLVSGIDVGDLTVWVSEAEAAPELGLDSVARHHAVVSAALGRPVLPLRFGAWHPDRAALEAAVRTTAAEHASALERVGGRLELGVRIERAGPAQGPEVDEPPDTREPPSGRQYLRELSRRRSSRVERRREQDELAARLRERLGEVAAEQRVQYLSPPELVSVAHLVEPEDEGRYRERVAAFAQENAGVLLLHVTGPWPPYSFAS